MYYFKRKTDEKEFLLTQAAIDVVMGSSDDGEKVVLNMAETLNGIYRKESQTHPFPPGTEVETNQNYFNMFGRKIKGVSVSHDKAPNPPDEITLVRWLYQEGNSIPQQQNQIVIMMSKDLQLVDNKKVH